MSTEANTLRNWLAYQLYAGILMHTIILILWIVAAVTVDFFLFPAGSFITNAIIVMVIQVVANLLLGWGFWFALVKNKAGAQMYQIAAGVFCARGAIHAYETFDAITNGMNFLSLPIFGELFAYCYIATAVPCGYNTLVQVLTGLAALGFAKEETGVQEVKPSEVQVGKSTDAPDPAPDSPPVSPPGAVETADEAKPAESA
jgi:hypothetical protein